MTRAELRDEARADSSIADLPRDELAERVAELVRERDEARAELAALREATKPPHPVYS